MQIKLYASLGDITKGTFDFLSIIMVLTLEKWLGNIFKGYWGIQEIRTVR
jgi:hypothetical protein